MPCRETGKNSQIGSHAKQEDRLRRGPSNRYGVTGCRREHYSRHSVAKGAREALDVPGSSRVGRAEHACGSDRFRSACGVDGRGAWRLLRDGSLRELSNRARATLADRSGLLTRFAGYGLALRELPDEKERTEGPGSVLSNGWLPASAAGRCRLGQGASVINRGTGVRDAV